MRCKGLLGCPPELVRARIPKHRGAHGVHVCIALGPLNVVGLQGGAARAHAQAWPGHIRAIWLKLAVVAQGHLQELSLRPQTRVVLILMHAAPQTRGVLFCFTVCFCSSCSSPAAVRVCC